MSRKEITEQPRYHPTRKVSQEEVLEAIQTLPDIHTEKTPEQKQEIIERRKQHDSFWGKVPAWPSQDEINIFREKFCGKPDEQK